MDEGREVQQEEQVVPVQTVQERDPVRETEQELGYEEQSLSLEDSALNSSYLASVATFGNQMMLEILGHRLDSSRKTVGRDTDEYTVIKNLIKEIVSEYDEKVGKENFPVKYGNMLEKYGQLCGACKLYLASHEKKPRKTAEGQKRLRYVEQTVQVAEREMSIIRQRSGVLADSEAGISWREMFLNEGKLELNLLHSKAEETKESKKPLPPIPGGAGGANKRISQLEERVRKLEARLDAPKLKELNEGEKAAWQGVLPADQRPEIMKKERFRALLAIGVFEGSELDEALVQRIEGLLDKIHWVDNTGRPAPVFSPRLLRQVLSACEEKRESSDVLRLLALECEAAQHYKAPEQPQKEPSQEQTQQPEPSLGQSPFQKPDGSLNDEGQVLNERLMPQLKDGTPNWTRIRLVYSLLREHRLNRQETDEEILDNIERDIIQTIGAGKTYPALEELRAACETIRQGRGSGAL